MLVLGATGRVAKDALALLRKQPEIGQIVMGGRDQIAVEARRAELDLAARVEQVDATDAAQIARVARDCDAILNLAGLDHATPISAARGALEAGCHYVDIAASATAVETLLDWTDEFRLAGLTGIPSIGSIPGAMNLLACHAAALLDHCESVAVNWGVPFSLWGDPRDVAASYASGAPVLQTHIEVVSQATRPAPVVRSGKLEWITPRQAGTTVTAPDGRTFVAWPIGTPEALTLPFALPEVPAIEARSALWPESVTQLARALGADGDVEAATQALFRELATWSPERLAPGDGFDRLAVWAQADGELNGQPHTVRCTPAHSLSTAGNAIAAVVLLAQRNDLPRGITPAECCFDPTEFLRAVLDIQGVEGHDPLINVHLEVTSP